MPTTRSKTKPAKKSKRVSSPDSSIIEGSKPRRGKPKDIEENENIPLLLETNITAPPTTSSTLNPSIISPSEATLVNLPIDTSQSSNNFALHDLLPIYEVHAPNSESIHDEFLQLVRDSGMETIAKDAGVISQNGELSGLKEYYSNAPDPIIERDVKEGSLVSKSAKKRKQTAATADNDATPGEEGKKKRRTSTKNANGEKLAKGLRHFSMKVCQKVESKKATNYNEVAEELVKEFNENGTVDHKNIRRRVYDALNVLMAMNIIAKDKKDIRWLGLPTNAKQELESLEADKQERVERIKKKRATFEELAAQENSYRCLIERNSKPELSNTESKISLPFIIVNTRSTTVIECEVADDRTGYFFNFSLPFEIHDDSEILKRLNL